MRQQSSKFPLIQSKSNCYSHIQMTKKFSLSSNCKSLRAILQLSLLAITLRCGNAARIFTEDDDTDTPTPPPVPPPEAHPPLSFFMHDILGGSAPSERVVAGITASTQINGLPFSKPNNRVFPIKGGVPLVTANNGININNGFVNNNNLPFLGGQMVQRSVQLLATMVTTILSPMATHSYLSLLACSHRELHCKTRSLGQ